MLALGSVAGCATAGSSETDTIPRVASIGSRAHEFTSLSEIADLSSALVVAEPTGEQHDVPLPPEEGGTDTSAPTTFARMRVTQVISGDVSEKTIDVVSPGTDEKTGRPALLTGGPYLMYLTPAMYGPDQPVGGYAIAGGPAGVYASEGAAGIFARVDAESPRLPQEIDPTDAPPPMTSHTSNQLLHAGPR